ncbi:MAG: DNA-deoxyinosine glycosylase [Steroidobacteraceae bacterium]|nr:DNA-deoxyinosine glycosylase [Steroidobacteraceae bacterium]MDW8258162.1 DNA-deoxyinosine glycosylase [Gammaproteobacteria bacterium]
MRRRTVGFGPVEPRRARLLILGTLPSEASLRAGEYYAHPRNAFWPIMGALLGFEAAAPYAQRCDYLRRAGIALWDVCQSAYRRGSLDAAIDRASLEPNDIVGLLRRQPAIDLICFNGGVAARLFARAIRPQLPSLPRPVQCVTLPSTSPAHATLSWRGKLARWRVIVRHLRTADL